MDKIRGGGDEKCMTMKISNRPTSAINLGIREESHSVAFSFGERDTQTHTQDVLVHTVLIQPQMLFDGGRKDTGGTSCMHHLAAVI